MINFAYNLFQSEYGTKPTSNFPLEQNISQNYFDDYFLPHLNLLKSKK